MTRAAPAAALDPDRGPGGRMMLDAADLRGVYASMVGPLAGIPVSPITVIADVSSGIRRDRGLLGFYSPFSDPLAALDDRQRLLASLYFAVAVVGRYVVGRGIHVPQLDGPTYPYPRLLEAAVVPFFVEGGMPGRQGFGGFHFTHEPGVLFHLVHEAPPGVARDLLGRIAFNRERGLPTSFEAEQIVSQILAGAIPFPPYLRSGRPCPGTSASFWAPSRTVSPR